MRVLPYVRGYYPRDTAYRLWSLMEAEGAASKLFFSGVPHGTDVNCLGDLTQFVQSLATRETLVMQHLESGEIAGLFWYEDFIPSHRALVSIFVRRRFWGEVAKEIADLGLRYGFEVFQLKHIWALTAWPTSASIAERCGMTLVATLEDYVLDEQGEPRDVKLYRKRRED